MAIIADEPGEKSKEGDKRVAHRTVALKAVLPESGARLTPVERALLSEWLDRIANPTI